MTLAEIDWLCERVLKLSGYGGHAKQLAADVRAALVAANAELATAKHALVEYAEWAPVWKRERDAALARVGELTEALQRDIGDGFNDCILCETAWVRNGLTGELHSPDCPARASPGSPAAPESSQEPSRGSAKPAPR